ncbi:MAG: hypothetical protein ACLF0G_05740 [Candidatus Brocadiia bacterium]
MRKVKLFKSVEIELDSLEQQINTWIEQAGAKVVSITGNIAPQSLAPESKTATLGTGTVASSDVLIVVVYEEPAS